MKKICYLFFIVAIPFVSIATVRTVSNQPSGGAQFNTIQLAVDASADGDTIYVHGSANIYDAFTVTDKKLTIIGPGWAPDKDFAFQAIIAGCTLRNSVASGSPSGTEFQGLIFSQHASLGAQFVGSDLAVGSLRIIRCQFNNSVNFSLGTSNDLFEGCVFLTTIGFNTNSQSVSNVLFQNNMFFANQCCTSVGIAGLNANISNVQFDHNVFYGDGSGAGVLAFGSGCQFLTLSNNIFSRRNPSGLSNSTFTNNITINCGSIGDTVWIRNGNTGTGNIAAQNPQTTTDITTAGFSGLNDFTITAGPANNAGSDGKDIGLLYEPSGSLNWTNSRNSRFPRMFSMNITTPTVAAGGNINVVVEARKSN